MTKRPSWPRYFMDITRLVATRSTCLRREVGAIIVKDRHILSTGYNGPPRGVPHCDELGGCLRQRMKIPSGQRHEICRAVHAEQNAIIQAAKMGITVEGAEMYITTQPCFICAKMIINAGIKRIIMDEGYPDRLAEEILEQAGVEVLNINDMEQE
ncbi:MAG: dCMP deaminase family protein [bacterium]